MHHRRKTGAQRVLAAAAGLSLVAALPTAASADLGTAPAAPIASADSFEDGSYIVVLADAPLATNPATAGSATKKVDTTSAVAQSYTDQLLGQQDAVLASVSAEATHRYTVALNGFAAELSGAEAAALAARTDVVSVTQNRMLHVTDVDGTVDIPAPDTDVSPDFLGLRGEGGVWEQIGGPMEAGKGLVVGVIDSGIAWDNPAFAADGMPSAPAGWAGECETGEGFPAEACSDKLVGARSFSEGLVAAGATIMEPVSPVDTTDHGSHVASTAAGRELTLSDAGGATFDIAGMAPGAHVAAYKVCWDYEFNGEYGNGCMGDDSIAAIDAAMADGVDVLNFSISGSNDTYTDPVDLAFKNAAAAGVFVATSSGNFAEEGEVANHTGPWMTTVGAATHRGADAPQIGSFSNRGPIDVPAAEQTILKPDLGAPGIDVLAAYASADGPKWGYMTGTSMASPHIAGLGALLAAEHPAWSPMAVKSALQTSTRDYTNDESNQAFVGGTGFVEPRTFLNPGLVFDSAESDWDAFLSDPASGYQLNAAYVQVPALTTTATEVTRTVTNPGSADATFTAAFSGPETLSVTVSPAEVTVPAGGTAEVTITVANTGAATDVWQEGRLTWTSDSASVEIPVIARGEVSDGGTDPEPDVKVERVWGENRYGTAAEVADLYESADTVYIASGTGFADALAGSPAASRGLMPGTLATPEGDPAPVLLVKNDALPSQTKAALDSIAPEDIVILGGVGAVSANVEEQLGAWGEVSRVAGENRYETAANLATMFGTGVDTVYLASGEDRAFADALAGGARAGMESAPVLLTKPGSLPSVTADALEALAPQRVVVLGGEVAVSQEVFDAAGADERIAGDNRYETAVALSQVHDADVPVVYIASGTNFPDALAGSALAGDQGVPVLLTKPESLTGATLEELHRLDPERVVILGGTVAVSQAVEDELNEYYPGWVD